MPPPTLLLTQRERIVPPGEVLVSRTDPRGVITYANSVFAGVSGYAQDELLGRSHNILRHPDMPAAVFTNMWHTLQQQRIWHGIIKNRCKNGDHYWVDALIVPLVEDGQATGYLSVRRQARRTDIEAAERHYQALRAGTVYKAQPYRFRLDRYLSIRSGVALGIVFVTLIILIGAAIGLGTIDRAEGELVAMHREKVEAGNALGSIKFLMADNRAQILLASLHDRKNPLSATHNHPLARHLDAVAANRHEIERLWQGLRQRLAPGDAAELADAYWAARARYEDEALTPASRALKAGNFAEANRIVARHLSPLYDAANRQADQLVTHLLRDANGQVAAERTLHETVWGVVSVGIAGSLMWLVFSGFLFFRGIMRPLETRIRDLERLAEGRLDAHVDVEGSGELGRLNRAFAVAQAKLQYLLDNSFRGATEVSAECAQLKTIVLEIGDSIENQHERVFRVLDRSRECATGIAEISAQMDALLAKAEQLAAADAPEKQGIAALAAEAHAIAATLRIISFTSDEMKFEMGHIADFLVDDREAMHAMWRAATHLVQTAAALEKAAGWFEIG